MAYYEEKSGPLDLIDAVNVVSPNQVHQEDFVKFLADELKVKKPRVNTPEWYLKLSIGKPAGSEFSKKNL